MKNKGVALLWALLLTLVLLIITGSMATTMAKENQTSVNNQFSAQAYANAKSGIEWAQATVSKDGCTNLTRTINFTTDSTANVSISGTDDNCNVKSVGKFGSATRKLEYKSTPAGQSKIIGEGAPNGALAHGYLIGLNNGGFTLKFNLWLNSVSGVNMARFGVRDAPENTKIYLEMYVATGVRYTNLVVTQKNPSTGVVTTQRVPIDFIAGKSLISTDANQYQVTLRYTKDWAVTLKIRERDDEGLYTDCIGSAFIDTSSYADLGSLNYLHAINMPGTTDSAIFVVEEPYLTDGAYIKNDWVNYDNVSISGPGVTETFNVDGNQSIANAATINCKDSHGLDCNLLSIPKDETITLTATAKTGYAFTGWSGSGCSGTGSCTVAVSSAITINASFVAAVNVYRFYAPSNADRIWTADPTEAANIRAASATWNDEGVGFRAFNTLVPGSVPVYRLYKAGATRMWTTDVAEKNTLVSQGWGLESSAAFYVYTTAINNSTLVKRFTPPAPALTKIWTYFAWEWTNIGNAVGWGSDGPAFYALPN